MARYQEREYHEDRTGKRPVTADDLQFLAELQKELNTQPDMGNADPLFWVIRQQESYPTAEGYDDGCCVVHQDSGESFGTMEEFAVWLDEGNCEGILECACHGPEGPLEIAFATDNEDICDAEEDYDGEEPGTETAYVYSLEDAVAVMEDHGIDGYAVQFVRCQDETVPGTLFLTHKDCEQHLKAYSYNYKDDAHAYAMTAVRSPRFGKLLDLIRTVDWGRVEAQQADGRA